MSTDIKVTTNNVPRKLSTLSQVPKKDRKDFDYIHDFQGSGGEVLPDTVWEERLVQYRGVWYDVRDTQRLTASNALARVGFDWHVTEDHPFAKWDAVISDSFFSGVLFRFVETDDGYSVICGRYYS